MWAIQKGASGRLRRNSPEEDGLESIRAPRVELVDSAGRLELGTISGSIDARVMDRGDAGLLKSRCGGAVETPLVFPKLSRGISIVQLCTLTAFGRVY
jgi:hypothetical protein